jgi:hypothetical protein
VSAGPALGPLEHFTAAYDAQVRASSQFGLEAAMRAEEVANSERIRAAGGTPPAPLNNTEDGVFFGGFTAGLDSGAYTDLLRAENEDDQARIDGLIGERNKQLQSLKKQFPNAGIMDYEEIRQGVFTKALDAERTMQRRSDGALSSIAGFFGGVAGALDPRVNPLNVITAPVGGGFARTMLGRVGLDAAIGAGTTALTEFGGGRETRQLLGLETNTLQDVAFGAVAGGVFSAGGEALGRAAGAVRRRWFADEPGAPAPRPEDVVPPEMLAPEQPTLGDPARVTVRPRTKLDDQLDVIVGPGRSPMASTAIGRARAADDFRFVQASLDDWGGPRPWEVPPAPRTEARALASDIEPVSVRPQIDAAVRSTEINTAMREVDPDAMKIWDRLADEDAAIRTQLAALENRTGDALTEELAPLTQEIARLRQVSQTATRRNAKKYAARIEEMQGKIDARIREVANVTPPEEMELRQALLRNEQTRWDVQPVIQRTAARARQMWEQEGSELYARVNEMVRVGAKALPMKGDAPEGFVAAFIPRDPVRDAFPGMSELDTKPGETIPQKAVRMVDRRTEAADKVVDTFRAAPLKLADEQGIIEVNGVKLNVNDKIKFGEGDDISEVSIKSLLDDIENDNAALQAITSCSIVRPS